jgi:HSP20 family protein
MRSLIPRRGEGLRRSGQHPLSRLRDEMENMFEQFFGPWTMTTEWSREQLWDMDMEEKPNEIVVRAEAPGFNANEFEVNAHGNMLTIKAEHREGEPKKETQEGEKQKPSTWGYRRFERSVTLPSGVAADKAEASYRNGVLELHLPRTEEARPHRIEVKA